MITTILFDVGDTLVHAAAPGTPVRELDVRPAAGAGRLLDALARRYRLGAVTDTAVLSGDEVRGLLASSELAKLLEVIVSSVDVGAIKPDPAGIQRALAQLDAAPSETLFVGDTTADEQAAQRAGTHFAARTPQRDLSGVVRDALAGLDGPYVAGRAMLGPVDHEAADRARRHHDQLTKPPGTLGRLEALGVQLAAIAGASPPPIPAPAAIAVFAGDHGVAAENVTSWPQEVTTQMVTNICSGGAGINVLARQTGAAVTVIDVGVAADVDPGTASDAQLLRRRVRRGTANLARGPALQLADVHAARDIGADIATGLIAGGARALVTGELGIGNTTPAAAVIAALTGRAASKVTGRGAGVDDRAFDRKTRVIHTALARLSAPTAPAAVLAEVGGLEIAALAGFIVSGAAHHIPVIVDGVVTCAALLAAHADCPAVLPYVIAGHRSTEPGAGAALKHLGLNPVLDLQLRLGEGTGACLTLSLLQAAAHMLSEMATFDDAGVGSTS
jgi:nicotinate-nucleotide--dimethylbenzimidazole phosphoribosyltransferase